MASFVVTLALAWWPTAWDLAVEWLTSRYGAHGACVALFAAYAVWERRAALPSAEWRVRIPAGLALALAGALLVVGHSEDSLTLRALSLPVAGLAVVLFGWGIRGARTLAFPLAFSLLAVPLPPVVISRLSAATQSLAASAAEQTLALWQVPVARDGLTFSIGQIDVDITEACDGLPFLLASVVVGIAAAWALRMGPRQQILVVVLAVVSGVAANLLRVAATAVLAWVQPAAVIGTSHLLFGKLVYLVVGGAVAAFAVLVVRRAPARSSR